MRKIAVVLGFALIAALSGCGGSPAPDLPAESLRDLIGGPGRYRYVDPVVSEIVAETGVPLDVLIRLIESESSWRVHVRSCIRQDGTYDIGLAQINVAYLDYFTAEYMEGALDPLHPVDSLRFAARYLGDLRRKTGNWEDAVVAYKSGLGRVGSEPVWVRRIAVWVVRG